MGKLLLLTWILNVYVLFPALKAQDKATETLHNLMQSIKLQKKEYYNLSPVYNNKDKQEIIDILSAYAVDSLPGVRSQALSIAAQVAEDSKKEEIQRQTTTLLCSACSDSSAMVRQTVFTYIKDFEKSNFTPKEVNSIRRQIINYPYQASEIIRLLGFIGDKTDIRTLKTLPGLSPKEDWSRHVALARLGSEESLNLCLEKIKAQPVNDDWTYNIAEELLYIRTRVSMDFLVKVLQEKQKNCSSPNPDAEGNIQCGYRIMELLAGYITDYPLEKDISGDIDCNNYPRCLEKARDWFKANPGYGINYGRY